MDAVARDPQAKMFSEKLNKKEKAASPIQRN
jgi:hypothetical protein